MSGTIDLHTHSNASDGACTPAQVVELASVAGLAGLALTDHDTLAGIEEARRTAKERNVRFLAGVELTTRCGDLRDVHLLGYCVDGPGNATLVAACERFRCARQQRAAKIVERLDRAGVYVRLASVQAEAGDGAIGRPHIARALVSGGWAVSVKDAFQQWLLPGKPGYVAHENIQTGDAVELLRDSGAVPVLAHPQTLGLTAEGLEALVKALVDRGLTGIEAYWSRQEPTTVDLCEILAGRYGLHATGGSDFHGDSKPNRLGETAQNRALGLDLMDALEAAAGE